MVSKIQFGLWVKWDVCVLTERFVISISCLRRPLHLPFEPQPFEVNGVVNVVPLFLVLRPFTTFAGCGLLTTTIGLLTTCTYLGWTMKNGGLDSPQPLKTVTVLVDSAAGAGLP